MGDWHETITVETEALHETRGDRVLAEHLAALYPRLRLSRRQITEALVELRVNGQRVKGSVRVTGGDRVAGEVRRSVVSTVPLGAEAVDFDVLYEDEYVVAINKPAGMAAHPGIGVRSGTVAQGLLARYPGLEEMLEGASGSGGGADGADDDGGGFRPGIIHRLDKQTTGILLGGKCAEAVARFARMFAERTIKKCYVAAVHGRMARRRGRLENILQRDPRNPRRFATVAAGRGAEDAARGREAITDYLVLREFENYSVVVLRPHTGRTHQLRVQVASVGAPIIGDSIYASAKRAAEERERGVPMHLHAARLSFVHPFTGEFLRLSAPLPGHIRTAITGGGYD